MAALRPARVRTLSYGPTPTTLVVLAHRRRRVPESREDPRLLGHPFYLGAKDAAVIRASRGYRRLLTRA